MTQQDCRGFSLIEVIIAMAIFSIGTLGLYAIQFNSAMGNTKANQQTGAVTAASQVVEQLMRTDYSAAALDKTMQSDGIPLSSPHNAADELPDLMIDHAPYVQSITWNVFDLGDADPDDDGTKRVDLTVTYKGGRRVNISFLRIELI